MLIRMADGNVIAYTFRVPADDSLGRRYNIAPTQVAPVVRARLVAKLAGVKYCPGNVLAAAAALGWKLLSGTQPYAPVKTQALAYVGDRSCAECHAKQSKEWLGSHHQRAMQPATDETVLGDFRSAAFTQGGAESRFFKREDKYYVHTEGGDGKPAATPARVP